MAAFVSSPTQMNRGDSTKAAVNNGSPMNAATESSTAAAAPVKTSPMNVYSRPKVEDTPEMTPMMEDETPTERSGNSTPSGARRGSLIDSAVDGLLGLVEMPKKALRKRILRKKKRSMEALKERQQAESSEEQQMMGDGAMEDGLDGLDATVTDDEDEMTDDDDEDSQQPPPNPLQTADYAIVRPSSSKAWELNIVTTFEKDDDPYHQYLHAIPCYDLAPVNGSVVVLDSKLTLHMAFLSLVKSEKPAALVWNDGNVVGMVTHTDFLEALIAAESEQEVHNKTLDGYFGGSANRQPLITATVTSSLWMAAQLCLTHHVHRLPIMELTVDGAQASETDILYLITLKDIFSESLLKQLGTVASIAPYMSKRIDDQRIGTWRNFHTTTPDAQIRSALKQFLKTGVSSLPVLDDQRRPVAVLTKHDVVTLLATHEESTYTQVLSMPVSEAMACRTEEAALPFCSPSDAVGVAIGRLLLHDHAQSLFALDDSGRLTAAVSVSDLMSYVMSAALVNSEQTSSMGSASRSSMTPSEQMVC